MNAILSITRTTFMLILLCGSAILFSKDSNDLILNPIERMLKKVKMISANPLEAARIAEDEAVAEEELRNIYDKKELEKMIIEKTYETSILE